MSILELLFTWKIRILRWMVYAIVLLCLIIFLLVKSINFAFTHDYTEREVLRGSGWDVELYDESNLSWHGGLALKYKKVDVLAPLVFSAENVELVLSDLIGSILGTGEVFDLYARRLSFDNVLLKDVRFHPVTANQYVLAAEGGNLNTGQGNPEVSNLLADALPAGRGQAELECLYLPFDVVEQTLLLKNGVLETGPAIIMISGQIGLDTGELEITLTPQSKDSRTVVQPLPLTIKGTTNAPEISIREEDIANRIGALLGRGTTIAPVNQVNCQEYK